eukprot:2558543-Ditylum_brightwellii.AAC.1
MGQVDPSLYVQSSNANDIWKTPVDVPTGLTFTTVFDIKQKTPMKGPSQVKAYVTLFFKLQLNTIQFENEPEDLAPVPDFRLVTSKAGWGNGPEHIETTVLKLLSTEKDRLFLKSLLSYVWEKSKLYGTFVPARACLVTSPETYRKLLCNHNSYIKSTTAIAIEGIHPQVAYKEIVMSAEQVTIRKFLLKKTKLIESMELTNSSEDRGKWFFIVQKKNITAASNFIDTELQKLYQKIIPNDLKFDHAPNPRRTYTCAAQVINSYADVLTGLAKANPQDENECNLDDNALCP